MMTYEVFLKFYNEHGYCPNDVSRSKNKMNETQLKSRYQKYLRGFEKREEAKVRHIKKMNENMKESIENKDYVDERWIEVCKIVDERDNYECQLIRYLNWNQYLLLQLHGPLIDQLDRAHVFSRGSHPHMKYDPDNIILLNRVSHGFIDQYRDPITGEQISKEVHEEWWRAILDDERYERLLEKSKNKHD